MDNKQQAFEIYKILIQTNSNFVDNSIYSKQLAELAIKLSNQFDSVYNNKD